MNRTMLAALLACLSGAALPISSFASGGNPSPQVQPQGTAFTYQGQLNQNNSPVTANVDMVFALFDGPIAGNQIGAPISFTAAGSNPVSVQSGIFSVTLDFGQTAFNGVAADERYLQITVNGSVLAPRTKIENAPYALMSRSAELALSVAGGSVGANEIIPTQVQKRISGACPAASISAVNADGTVVCTSGSSGTVTKIDTTGGLAGGPITSSGSISIAAGGVDDTKLASAAVTKPKIADGAVDTSKIADNSIVGAKIASLTIDGSKITDNAITGQKIADGAITGPKLAAQAVDTAQLALNAVHTAQISNSAVTSTQIANSAVGSAQINQAQVQLRVSQSCSSGAISAVNQDGSVVCSADYSGQPITTADSSGTRVSLVIGTDGNPIFSMGKNNALTVVHCNDGACQGAKDVTQPDGTVAVTGVYSSIAIDPTDGFPSIAYAETSFNHIKFVHCTSLDCATHSTSIVVDGAAGTGPYASLAFGGDKLPVMAYQDSIAKHPKVAHCANPDCSSSIGSSTIDSNANRGIYTAIAIGATGLPSVAYFDASGTPYLFNCSDAACAVASAPIVLDSSAGSSLSLSLLKGSDGKMLVSYGKANVFKVAHCDSTTCAAPTVTTVDSNGSTGLYSSAKVGNDGLPIISYVSALTGTTRVAHCSDLACQVVSIAAVEATSSLLPTSLGVPADGLPVVAYNAADSSVRVVKCASRTCF